MSRWTEQTAGAKAHNEAQARERAERDEQRLVEYEQSGESLRAHAARIGMSPQRLHVIVRRAREARVNAKARQIVGLDS